MREAAQQKQAWRNDRTHRAAPHMPEPAAHIATPSLNEAPRAIASIVHRTTMPVATAGKFIDDTIAAIG
ncbi:hypothetical protein KDX16_00720 [Burkholderia vietnamiensis]|uniref:hypothetical protein n=1 Tax=Burkholderia vietnamiensis TaxID=60552 RepID=UPI000B248AF4|nr:hypothetical protein [Burkholderia vietnamiensis]MBR7914362.1 hypothetical protein [Burkholderia vietnamiensis]MDN7923802.1 hypothetical protein [Burkholderia vietnamiensis]HDR9253456.1 hypothetical protein [Burkholderia vietnamiensis]